MRQNSATLNGMWRSLRKSLATMIPAALLIIFIAVMICFLNRWDSIVAITLIPVWTWAAFGMAASFLSWIFFRGPFAVVVFSIWMASGLLLSEEPRSLLRELFSSDDWIKNDQVETLRVINIDAAEEAKTLRTIADLAPDLVVIQRAPERQALEDLAADLYSETHQVVSHRGNALILRGEAVSILREPDSATIHVRLLTPEGWLIDVTNIDLEPYLPSAKLWKPEVWTRLTTTRIQNRRRIRAYLGENQIASGTIGRIVSGGFGTPPGDDVYRPLQSAGMLDAFEEAGTGWGNTYPSDHPLVRLDQIWSSPNLPPLRAKSVLNPGSGHRTVMADLTVKLPD
ncbi:MAG: hypothetical protein AAGA96_12845 [Verrucomicrobiota bacterium]